MSSVEKKIDKILEVQKQHGKDIQALKDIVNKGTGAAGALLFLCRTAFLFGLFLAAVKAVIVSLSP